MVFESRYQIEKKSYNQDSENTHYLVPLYVTQKTIMDSSSIRTIPGTKCTERLLIMSHQDNALYYILSKAYFTKLVSMHEHLVCRIPLCLDIED